MSDFVARYFYPRHIRKKKFHRWLDRIFNMGNIVEIIRDQKGRKDLDMLAQEQKDYWRI